MKIHRGIHQQTLPTNDSRSSTSRSGVIAVLFLFVVAFIFAAISLSMQTGQIVERRILTDQAADSAAYAFASKSAQGLNFIAVNNLAIAASSHMAGVIHIAADWGIIVKVLFQAKSVFKGGKITMPASDREKYDKIYRWLAPIAQIYFRSAEGLTRLSAVIKSSFPYLGMVDAMTTGASNVPGAIFLPFGAPHPGAAAGSPADTSADNFMTKVFNSLKKAVGSLLPSYKGIKRINSDETFCLAYKAGESMGGDQHRLKEWFSGNATEPFPFIGEVFNIMANAMDAIGFIGSLVGVKVGFSGCGFGETGDTVGGTAAIDKSFIAMFLVDVLRGPMSGRPIKIPLSETESATIQPFKTAEALEQEVNGKYNDICQPATKGQWKVFNRPFEGWAVETGPDPRTGLCIWPHEDGKALRYKKDNTFQKGKPVLAGEIPKTDETFLKNYDVICHGTLLFKWEAYSGLLGEPKKYTDDSEPKEEIVFPAPEPTERIDQRDRKTELCQQFEATLNNGAGQAMRYPRMPDRAISKLTDHFSVIHDPSSYRSYVNMSRERSFLDPIISGLAVASPTVKPPKWRGADPPVGSFREITILRSCAAGVYDACPFNDDGHYFKNENGDRFYPDLNKLNWLCPAAELGDSAAQNIRQTMKFDDPNDGSRWSHAEAFENNQWVPKSKYPELQAWHNAQVDQLVNRMDCASYQKYKSAKPTKENTGGTSNTNSHDYCASDAHMCWQAALQKNIGSKLKMGRLSFFIPSTTTRQDPIPLADSLHYAVLTMNTLRTDNLKDIVGSDPSLPNCPKNLAVDATLEDGTTVKVCDIQPAIGFVSRLMTDSNGQKKDLENEQFGGGDTNLASGGGIDTSAQKRVGTSGFMAISQSGVEYESALSGEYEPGANITTTNAKLKTHQLFWPSWKPVLEPSRILSRILPQSISPIVED